MKETSRVKPGVLVSTYALLRTRMKQVLRFLRPAGKAAFMVFDEAHAAKHHNTGTCKNVVHLQTQLDAGCIFASATAAQSCKEFAPFLRLGLWGDGTQYRDVKEFSRRFSANSNASAEVVTACLASEGGFLARTLSLSGCEFGTSVVPLTDEQQETHAALVGYLLDLWKSNCFDTKALKSNFWSAHLLILRNLLVAFRAVEAARHAWEWVSAGHGCCVVSLCGTGEAANASEEIEIDDELGAMAIKETLRKLVAKADGLSDELRNRLDSLTLPPAPLDMLVNELDALFGTDRV
eukprot:7384885-Prymnesium_polylepis.1